MIKIVIDSTAYMPKEYAEEHDVTVVPLRYLYKDQEFIEGFPGTYDEFYADFTKSKIFPKTSQPSLETFTEVYNSAIDKGDEVLVFTISSTLSGTFNVATLAKNQCKAPEKVFVVDSLANCQGILGIVMEAVDLRDEGKSMQEILDRIEVVKKENGIMFIPDSLEYLARGGRIGKMSATLGTLLQIKPILTFKNGNLTDKKCIGMQKAIKEMLAAIPEKIKRLFVVHIASSKFFELLKKLFNQWFEKRSDKDKIKVYESDVGPVNAAHVGPAIGIGWSII